MTDHDPILIINELFSGFESLPLLRLTTDLMPGEHLVISGPSGCGKSSLLQVLAGLRPAQHGHFYWQDQPISEHNLSWWRQQFCYLPQQPVMGAETIAAMLLLPWQLNASPLPQPDNARCVAVLVALGLQHPLDKAVNMLSGGEKQRLAIARALLMERPLWLLDEPTSALDPASRDRVMALLALQQQTMISVSHDPVWVAAAHCQYVMGEVHG
ncbi:ABC transporter ATP-binding protein [Photobacterium nomapromontoriensis]|uniref:ABC transporter ATP-binding protein n=1 Tax=Photobacterium nomapromontoriensis TaxID=2910237 RepID=UPI003D0D2488